MPNLRSYMTSCTVQTTLLKTEQIPIRNLEKKQGQKWSQISVAEPTGQEMRSDRHLAG